MIILYIGIDRPVCISLIINKDSCAILGSFLLPKKQQLIIKVNNC